MLNRGTVGDSACGGEGACFENSNDVGMMSCQGCEICRSSAFCLFPTGRNIMRLSNITCLLDRISARLLTADACSENSGQIGSRSW